MKIATRKYLGTLALFIALFLMRNTGKGFVIVSALPARRSLRRSLRGGPPLAI